MFYRRHHRLILSALVLVIIASVLVGFEMAQSLMPAHADNLQVGMKWYFAEGRVGRGFREYFTVSNPTVSACTVQFEYLYVSDSTPNNNSATNNVKIVTATVKAQSRMTESVNADLGVPDNAAIGTTNSTIVDVNLGSTPTCSSVVVERPMYFTSFQGVSSGTDIIGATDAQLGTTFFFADVPTGSAGSSWLSILNPQTTAANVQVDYFVQSPDEVTNNLPGSIKNYQTLTVSGMSRGTVQPGNLNMPYPHIAARITSDQPVLVERPSYFTLSDGYNVTGAADIVGVPSAQPTWYFAEGQAPHVTVGIVPDIQENLIIANPDTQNAATVKITLYPSDPSVAPFPVPTQITVQPNSQVIWDVNKNNTFTGATSEVAAVVDSVAAQNNPAVPVVVQRQIYQLYRGVNKTTLNSQIGWSAQSVTDAFGATQLHSADVFAEGYAASFYNERLLLLNPSTKQINVDVTLTNTLGRIYTQHLVNVPTGRSSYDITSMVEQNLVQVGDDNRAYEVSMTVSSNNGNFVAERSQYYHPTTYNVQGGSSVVGYTG
jgi:hypothetical protein